MGDVVKVSWSGGKDSTCALDMHLKQGDTVKAVCYVPMLTKDIPLLFPDHMEFITNTAKRFQDCGAEINIIHGKTYEEFFYTRFQKGKHVGMYYGFPLPFAGKCGFAKLSKIAAIHKFDIGEFDYEDVGIAFDELSRYRSVDGVKKRSILIEKEITEEQAKDYCKQNGLLSPNYLTKSRDGCGICPNATKREREIF